MQNVLFNSVTRVYKEPIVKYLFTMLTIKSVKIWFKFLKMAGQKKKMRLIIILLVMKM